MRLGVRYNAESKTGEGWMRAFRDVVAYMGFGFYWAWIFVSF